MLITDEQCNWIRNAIPSFDWRDIAAKLKQQQKKEGPLTWYYITKKEGEWSYESNNEERYLGPKENDAFEGEEYLHLDLTNLDLPEFNSLKEYISNINNVNYIGFHCLGPNSKVQEHTDKNAYSFIINLTLKENSDDVYLNLGNTKHTFTIGEAFLFDGDIPHYAVNTSDEDWVMLAIRFKK
jgi:hypothetical protein